MDLGSNTSLFNFTGSTGINTVPFLFNGIPEDLPFVNQVIKKDSNLQRGQSSGSSSSSTSTLAFHVSDNSLYEMHSSNSINGNSSLNLQASLNLSSQSEDQLSHEETPQNESTNEDSNYVCVHSRKAKTPDPQNYEFLLDYAVRYRNDWKKITKVVLEVKKIKSNPQILKRIYDKLKASQKQQRTKFTHEEDLEIIRLVQEVGLDWTKISYHLNNKTPIMIKNRYYSYIRKNFMLTDSTENTSDSTDSSENIVKFEEVTSPKLVTILTEENKDLPFFNKTYHELNYLGLEDELHVKITPVCHQFDERTVNTNNIFL